MQRTARDLRVVLGLLLAVVASAQGASGETILSCTFIGQTAIAESRGDQLVLDTERGRAWSVVFAELTSAVPKMKGNVGESALRVLRRDADTIWLAEAPPLGGMNVWSIFLKQRIALLSKQYEVVPGQPFGMLTIGRCR